MSRIVAILGAESTGKTTLARGLAEALAQRTGQRCTWVPEHLRAWCDAQGRTPRLDEQAGIARAQAAAIEAAAVENDWVVADTTPLMTAVYSQHVFGDGHLFAEALAWQRRCLHTLVTGLDLPWVADGLQRDGPQVRVPVDDLLRGHLMRAGLPWSVVLGAGPNRAGNALGALGLRAPGRDPQGPAAEAPDDALARWAATGPRLRCRDCDDPACERQSHRDPPAAGPSR
ncbi:MAG: AAA family ATPase [Rubrivivax sp.]